MIAALLSLLVEGMLALAELLAWVAVSLGNFSLQLIELVVGLFVDGFSMVRWKLPRWRSRDSGEDDRGGGAPLGAALLVLVLLLAAAGTYFAPSISRWATTREIQLQAANGKPVPLARVVIRTPAGEQAGRTDLGGYVRVPRWDLADVTVKDPRVVEQTWKAEAVVPVLVVQESAVGRGLNALTSRLRAAGR